MSDCTADSIKLLDIPTAPAPAALPATVQTAPVAARPAVQHLPQQQSETARLIAVIAEAARDPQVDISKMERLWEMHEKMQDRAALGVFNDRMCAAQAEMTPVSKNATNPQTKSRYATYDQLDDALRPIYTKHGFSISYDTGDGAPEGHIRVLAYVSCGGYTRTYKTDIPADGKGAKGGEVMTKTHATMSADSYGMRNLLRKVFNVAVSEGDDDGNGAGGNTTPTGESPDKPKDPVLVKGWAESEKGMKALTDWWGNLTRQQRNTYSRDFGLMKKDAEAVDRKGAARG